MKEFLITSAICQLTLLAVYHLFLEREKMNVFNRFYLLLSVVVSFVIPFLKFEIVREIPEQPKTIEVFEPMFTAIPQPEKVDYIPLILFGIYILITFFLAMRFLKNILQIRQKMKSGTSIDYNNAKLVLLDEKSLPHTFLNTIFINKNDYENRNIEDELYQHELTHVSQKHTLDVLFIEIVKTLFWFNPLIYFYKKAIQLNHEFLADEKVVESHKDIPFYQKLLLSKASTSQTFYLASNLNYLITKKRMIMMTKTTSQMKSTLYKLALIPVLTGLFLLFCVEITAQTKPTIVAENITKLPSDEARDHYYAGVRVIAKDTDGKILVDKKYEDLTKEEKDRFLYYVPKKAAKKSPTSQQFEELKDAKKHAIWIDGLHVSNLKLSEYKASDFAKLTTSSVYKNARSKKFPQPYQSSLYTDSYFEKNIKDSHKKFSGDKIEIVVGDYAKTKKVSKKKANEKEWEKVEKILQAGTEQDEVIAKPEVSPEFPGGIKEFYKYVTTNFKLPADFKGKAKIITQFIIEKDGSLSNIKILREVGFGSGKETVRVLQESPKWKPGIQNGKAVRVLYTLPISLNTDKK